MSASPADIQDPLYPHLSRQASLPCLVTQPILTVKLYILTHPPWGFEVVSHLEPLFITLIFHNNSFRSQFKLNFLSL